MLTSPALLRWGFLVALVAAFLATRYSPALADDEDELTLESDDDVGADVAEASSDELKKQPASYHQRAIIRPTGEAESALKAFVVAPNGNLITLVQLHVPPEDEGSGVSILSALIGPPAKPDRSKAPPPACEVRIFRPDGKHERVGAWPVSFMAQTIGLGPDNQLYIAGAGRVARYSLEGTELAVADSPQAALVEKDQGALREAAEAQIESDKENVKENLDNLKSQRDTIKAQIDKQSGKTDSAQLKSLESQLEQFDAMITQITPEERPIEEVMAEITARVKGVNAIAASEKDVFITCPQAKGYGYSVWRTDRDFANPQCIVTGLSGCCGQMDVCCGGGDLWVAENSRHRVVRYDREGKRLAAFGKRSRDGIGGAFGGCCNPMNLCFDKGGDLLVSESNGQVKHFTTKGKFVELTGVAGVQPGCKNSAIRISPEGEQIYYIDVNQSQILVLERDKKVAKKDG